MQAQPRRERVSIPGRDGSPCAALLGIAVVGLGGCAANIVGTWRTTQVEPPGIMFPLDEISFDGQGRYTASWSQDDEKHTSVGAYRQSMSQLEITQDGRLARKYRLKRKSDDSLVMIYREGENEVAATLTREPGP